MHFALYKNIPAADPTATSPKIMNAALEDVAGTPWTVFAAPVDSGRVVSSVPDAPPLTVPVAVSVAVVDSCAVVLETELLPLAEPDSEPISLEAGLQTTVSTLLLKHSPSSWNDCPSLASHTAVHGNGMPIALNSPPEQHAYMSQKAWSFTSAALLMAHPP
jgi:hypothetical protein